MSEPGWARANPATEKQDRFVRALQHRLHLPDALLDNHCLRRFRVPYLACDRRQVSELIDEMRSWEDLPVDLMRAKGQQDLPGMGPQ
jgi:hypothetical protein